MPARQAIDVLLISPGTTAGWRRADADLRSALEELGLSVVACRPTYRLARYLRRTVLSTDLAEAAALRLVAARAFRRYEPRAVIYSSSQAAMLQPRVRLGGATAVRFDVPAAFNRRGFGSFLLHALERRALRHVRLLLPIGVEAGHEAREVAGGKSTVALPIPIEMPPGDGAQREPVAVTYAGNPEKKGLDIVAGAWALGAPSGWRLVVTGIGPRSGRRFLAARGVAVPESIEWAGVLEAAQYRRQLKRATVFLSGSRYEDYGLAQLEALATGALLVTTPAGGPYEAVALLRELDPRLVAAEGSARALAEALGVAVAFSDEERLSFQRRARAHLRPYSRETLKQRLEQQALPLLLA
jgi:glycosyltransferase involved in cell wall biosynthesis